ncbi:hypothetical protein HAX54_011453 [Datura stramonium]|uniref:Uncharacterized protein n=1 Tax=Datura stramonium TaxID=4076 RepID=A0ABS8TIV1_DATST|nr:hypothetical protein [Datura stramonium]
MTPMTENQLDVGSRQGSAALRTRCLVSERPSFQTYQEKIHLISGLGMKKKMGISIISSGFKEEDMAGMLNCLCFAISFPCGRYAESSFGITGYFTVVKDMEGFQI